MSTTNIHSTAIVNQNARIGKNVTIEPFAIIGPNVVLEDGVTIKASVYLDGYTTIGSNTVIWPSAVIGTKCQDLKFKGEKTYVNIGSNCEIREFVTISSSAGEGTSVTIGDNCLIMIGCHIAHNCEVGNNVIMSNNAVLAGHVIVEDYAIIGGMTAVHQFSRIGTQAMVGGFSRVTHDVLPYTIGGGVPFKMGGINRVGLSRRDFDFEVRKSLAKGYNILYKSGLNFKQAVDALESELGSCAEIQHMINFCKTSQRGLIGFHCSEEKDSSKVKNIKKNFCANASLD